MSESLPYLSEAPIAPRKFALTATAFEPVGILYDGRAIQHRPDPVRQRLPLPRSPTSTPQACVAGKWLPRGDVRASLHGDRRLRRRGARRGLLRVRQDAAMGPGSSHLSSPALARTSELRSGTFRRRLFLRSLGVLGLHRRLRLLRLLGLRLFRFGRWHRVAHDSPPPRRGQRHGQRAASNLRSAQQWMSSGYPTGRSTASRCRFVAQIPAGGEPSPGGRDRRANGEGLDSPVVRDPEPERASIRPRLQGATRLCAGVLWADVPQQGPPHGRPLPGSMVVAIRV